MSGQKAIRKNSFNTLLFLFVVLFYGFYPVWFVPAIPAVYRMILLNIFVGLIGGIIYWWPGLTDISADLISSRDHAESRKSNVVAVGIFVLAIVAHLPFWILPVVTGDDMQSHISPAATVLGHMYRFIPPLAVTLMVLGAVVFLFLYGRIILRKLQKFNLIYWLPVCLLNIYAFFLIKTNLVETVGMWQSVFRYPPVAKLVYLMGYALFGINEFVGRGIQFVFLAGTAVYVFKAVKAVSERADSDIVLFLALFFPTFFHFSNYSVLENGTVFFFAAMSYHFLKSLEENRHISWVVLWLSIGLLYKRLTIGFVPVMLFYLLYKYYKNKVTIGFFKKYLHALLVPALIGLPFTAMGAILKIRNAASKWDNIFYPAQLGQNLIDLIGTLGPFLSALLFLSVVWCVFKRKRFNLYWIMLILGYYLMISLTHANGYIRHAQPVYLGLFYFFAVAVTDFIYWAKQKNKKILVMVSLLLTSELVYSNFFAADRVQRTVLRNRFENIYPYGELMDYLKLLVPEKGALRVYAPAEVEPSHFYLAKHKLTGKILWDRTAPANINKKVIVDKAGQYDYLCLPEIGTVYNNYKDVIMEIIDSEEMKLLKVFDYKGNRIFLFRPLDADVYKDKNC
ncbi:glycosyltransferase family 39 protein [bacterium]|nr:glycosyltransferase family 39 protein [Candidatus Omnitrophota bacterium]MBU4122775.1 glycosyltransferase family 39 protein [bacterium]